MTKKYPHSSTFMDKKWQKEYTAYWEINAGKVEISFPGENDQIFSFPQTLLPDNNPLFSRTLKSGGEEYFFTDPKTGFDLCLEKKVERSSEEQGPLEDFSTGKSQLFSPMPGKIFKLLVKEGDKVKAHERLIILEAMKMEHPVVASKEARIKKIHVKEGDIVPMEHLLLELDFSCS